MKNNLPSVLFVVLAIMVGLAFASGACSSQTELERARAETVRQEVNLEQAKAATTIANADAFTEKSQASLPYVMIAIFVGAGLLIFCAWYLIRSEAPRERQTQASWPQVQQPAQLQPPIVINFMLPASGDTRPAMISYPMEFNQGQRPYLIDAQPTQTRDVAVRLID